MQLTTEDLLNFLERKLGVEITGLDRDTPIFSSGVVDSLGMVELIAYVESMESVKFGSDDIILDNLDSIGRILNFIAQQHDR